MVASAPSLSVDDLQGNSLHFLAPRGSPAFRPISLLLLGVDDGLSILPLTLELRTDEELLVRRLRRVSSGSRGDSPEARAYKFSTSVSEITPVRCPDSEDAADAAWAAVGVWFVDEVCGAPSDRGATWAAVAGLREGEGGTDECGEGDSTTHILCERVATSFATVWARVEKRFTWKTG